LLDNIGPRKSEPLARRNAQPNFRFGDQIKHAVMFLAIFGANDRRFVSRQNIGIGFENGSDQLIAAVFVADSFQIGSAFFLAGHAMTIRAGGAIRFLKQLASLAAVPAMARSKIAVSLEIKLCGQGRARKRGGHQPNACDLRRKSQHAHEGKKMERIIPPIVACAGQDRRVQQSHAI
jgi:hypothetical protein